MPDSEGSVLETDDKLPPSTTPPVKIIDQEDHHHYLVLFDDHQKGWHFDKSSVSIEDENGEELTAMVRLKV